MNICFVVGTGRCGSSLINEIIARHPETAFVTNIDNGVPRLNLKGRWNNALFRTPLGRLTRNPSLIKFAPSEAFELISKQVSSIYANSSRDLEAADVTPWLERRFTQFFCERHRIQGKPLFLHKYTGWSRIGFFNRIFPQARFLHIVRDGRAVANSWLQMPWWGGYRGPENWLWGELTEPYKDEWLNSGGSYVRLAAIAWKLLMDSYERGAAQLPADRYMLIRYEDFVARPQETMERVLPFLHLPWTADFDKRFRRQKIVTSRSNAFERDLSSRQLEELEASLGTRLVTYGYLTAAKRLELVR
ncbi:MAG: sulfotransferase [Gammaproteobacteria bacterium]|jgi:hypothetical protein